MELQLRQPTNPKLIDDMAAFGRALIASKDVDPLYFMLRYLEKGMEEEQALWFTFLYLAYYNVASAVRAFRLQPMPGELPRQALQFPVSSERRGFRSLNRFDQHLRSYLDLCAMAGKQAWFLKRDPWYVSDYPEWNYENFWNTAQTVWGNGRWAAFKWAEILKKVHGWNIAAPDMRMKFCSGPREGLLMVYGLHKNTHPEALDLYGVDLRRRLLHAGLRVADWEELETVLCNFHSVQKGRYYVGHDIDELQHTITHSRLAPADVAWLFEARQATLPNAYLGELHGWSGVDPLAKTFYRETGHIYDRGAFCLPREKTTP